MALKFNGVYQDVLRWYNSESGEIVAKPYEGVTKKEILFSRTVLKTKSMTLTIHPDHTPDKNGFWICGYQADKDGRITFQTGNKNRIVISKNETDFLFCSTNQPFRSCFSLQSGGPTQLKVLQRTPGIYITYVTQENADFEYRGHTYTHPKMSGRAFLYVSQDGRKFTVGRPYGKNGFELRDALRRFFPNGLHIGWELSEEQKAVTNIEYDNFNDTHTIHDKYDNTFNDGSLYKAGGIIKIIGGTK